MLNQYPPILTACLTTFVTVVAVTDSRCHRIPNWLTVPAAVTGLMLNLVVAGAAGAATSGAGLLVGLAVFMPLYVARQFGGGDVKAMAAIGAFLGPKAALLTAMWILMAGGVGALGVLAATGGCRAVQSLAGRWMFRAWVLCTTGRPTPVHVPTDDAMSRRFPYGLAIACGTLGSLIAPLAWR